MFSASSMYNHLYGPWSARLQAQNRGSMRGGWIAKYNNRHQFLQVDLGTASRVKRIATQARYDANQWVKSYTVSYSNNGVRFFPYRQGKRVKVRSLHCLFFRSSLEAIAIREIMSEIFQSCILKIFRSRDNSSCSSQIKFLPGYWLWEIGSHLFLSLLLKARFSTGKLRNSFQFHVWFPDIPG